MLRRWMATVAVALCLIGVALTADNVDPCKRQAFRGRCPSVNGAPQMRSQFVLRYYLRSGECVSYPYGHCTDDENEPRLFRYKEECEDVCLGAKSTTIAATTTEATTTTEKEGDFLVVEPTVAEEVEGETQLPHVSGEYTYGTATADEATTPNTNYDVPKTECQRQRDVRGQGLIKGGFVPECSANGEFKQLQCEQDKQECFCVNAEGIEIDNSRTKPGDLKPNCAEIIAASPARTNECIGGSDIGPCRSSIPRWYYNEETLACAQFFYSGCGGNGNNYPTEAACLHRCAPAKEAGKCAKGKDPLRTAQGRVVNCAKTDCPAGYKCNVVGVSSICCPDLEKSLAGALPSGVGAAACDLPKERGSCDRYELRYYYNKELKECKYFFYGGCEGNDNNFGRVEDCEQTCGVVKGTSSSSEVPIAPVSEERVETTSPTTEAATTSEAATTTEEPSTTTEEVVETTVEETEATTSTTTQQPATRPVRTRPTQPQTTTTPEPTTTTPELPTNRCVHPLDTGNCGGQFVRWIWNNNLRKCETFTYTGCGGNGNNFATQEECLSLCHIEVVKTKSEVEIDFNNICESDIDIGECTGFFMRYAFDKNANDCRQFQYGGCGGNGNNFATLVECRRRCNPRKGTPEPEEVSTTPVVPEATSSLNVELQTSLSNNICDHPIEAGECTGIFQRFAYDSDANECRPFEYGGCGGNGNNFATFAECRTACNRVQCPPAPNCDTTRCQTVNDSRGCPFCSCPPPAHPPIVPTFNQNPACPQLDVNLCVEPCIIFSNRRGCKECVCPVMPGQGPTVPQVLPPAAAPAPPANEISLPEPINRSPAPPAPIDEPQVLPRPTFVAPPSAPAPPASPAPPAPPAFSRVATNEITQPVLEGVATSVEQERPLPPPSSRPRATIADLGEKCTQSVDPGPCKNFVERWHFNQARGECEPFQYGGCAGNRNHFFARKECEIHCARFSRVRPAASIDPVGFQRHVPTSTESFVSPSPDIIFLPAPTPSVDVPKHPVFYSSPKPVFEAPSVPRTAPRSKLPSAEWLAEATVQPEAPLVRYETHRPRTQAPEASTTIAPVFVPRPKLTQEHTIQQHVAPLNVEPPRINTHPVPQVPESSFNASQLSHHEIPNTHIVTQYRVPDERRGNTHAPQKLEPVTTPFAPVLFHNISFKAPHIPESMGPPPVVPVPPALQQRPVSEFPTDRPVGAEHTTEAHNTDSVIVTQAPSNINTAPAPVPTLAPLNIRTVLGTTTHITRVNSRLDFEPTHAATFTVPSTTTASPTPTARIEPQSIAAPEEHSVPLAPIPRIHPQHIVELPPKEPVLAAPGRQFAQPTFDHNALEKHVEFPDAKNPYIPPAPATRPDYTSVPPAPVPKINPTDVWPGNTLKPHGGSYGMQAIRPTPEGGHVQVPAGPRIEIPVPVEHGIYPVDTSPAAPAPGNEIDEISTLAPTAAPSTTTVRVPAPQVVQIQTVAPAPPAPTAVPVSTSTTVPEPAPPAPTVAPVPPAPTVAPAPEPPVVHVPAPTAVPAPAPPAPTVAPAPEPPVVHVPAPTAVPAPAPPAPTVAPAPEPPVVHVPAPTAVPAPAPPAPTVAPVPVSPVVRVPAPVAVPAPAPPPTETPIPASTVVESTTTARNTETAAPVGQTVAPSSVTDEPYGPGVGEGGSVKPSISISPIVAPVSTSAPVVPPAPVATLKHIDTIATSAPIAPVATLVPLVPEVTIVPAASTLAPATSAPIVPSETLAPSTTVAPPAPAATTTHAPAPVEPVATEAPVLPGKGLLKIQPIHTQVTEVSSEEVAEFVTEPVTTTISTSTPAPSRETAAPSSTTSTPVVTSAPVTTSAPTTSSTTTSQAPSTTTTASPPAPSSGDRELTETESISGPGYGEESQAKSIVASLPSPSPTPSQPEYRVFGEKSNIQEPIAPPPTGKTSSLELITAQTSTSTVHASSVPTTVTPRTSQSTQVVVGLSGDGAHVETVVPVRVTPTVNIGNTSEAPRTTSKTAVTSVVEEISSKIDTVPTSTTQLPQATLVVDQSIDGIKSNVASKILATVSPTLANVGNSVVEEVTPLPTTVETESPTPRSPAVVAPRRTIYYVRTGGEKLPEAPIASTTTTVAPTRSTTRADRVTPSNTPAPIGRLPVALSMPEGDEFRPISEDISMEGTQVESSTPPPTTPTAFTPRPVARPAVNVPLPDGPMQKTTVNEEIEVFGPPRPATPVDDETCVLPPDAGRCNQFEPRWFFNAEAGVCQEFAYGSCGGNANNFRDQAACEAKCATTLPLNVALPERCLHPKDEGTGNGYYPKYYFNARNLRCEQMVYQGFGGNDNQFSHAADCERSCKPVQGLGFSGVRGPPRKIHKESDKKALPHVAKGASNVQVEDGYGNAGLPSPVQELPSNSVSAATPSPYIPPQGATVGPEEVSEVASVPIGREQTLVQPAAPGAYEEGEENNVASAPAPAPAPVAAPAPAPAPVAAPAPAPAPVAAPAPGPSTPVETEVNNASESVETSVSESEAPAAPEPTPVETSVDGSDNGAAEVVVPPTSEEAHAPASSNPGYNAEPAADKLKPTVDSNQPILAPSPKATIDYSTGKRLDNDVKANGVPTAFDKDFGFGGVVVPDDKQDLDLLTNTGFDSQDDVETATQRIPTCANGLNAMTYADGRPVMCLPGKDQCPANSVCYFNGMDFFCCPNAEDPYDKHVFGGYDGEEVKHGYKSNHANLNIRSLRSLRARRQTAFSIDSATRPLRFDDKPVQQISRAGLASLRVNPCTQDVEKGVCSDAHLRYFYDIKSDSCRLFYYSGCGGNANNFMNQASCEQRCKLGLVITSTAAPVLPGRCPGGKMPLGDNAPVLCGDQTDSIGCPSGYYCRAGPPDVCCPGEVADVPALENILAATRGRDIRRKPFISAAGRFDGGHDHHHHEHEHHHVAHGVANTAYEGDVAAVETKDEAAEAIDAPAAQGEEAVASTDESAPPVALPESPVATEDSASVSETAAPTTTVNPINAPLPDTMCPDGSNALLDDAGKPVLCGSGFDGFELAPKGYYCSIDPERNSRLCCTFGTHGSNIPPPPVVAPYFGHRRSNPGEVLDRGSLPSDPKPTKLSTPKPKTGQYGSDEEAEQPSEGVSPTGSEEGAEPGAPAYPEESVSKNIETSDQSDSKPVEVPIEESSGPAQVAAAPMPTAEGHEHPYAHLMLKPFERVNHSQKVADESLINQAKSEPTAIKINDSSNEDPFELEKSARPVAKTTTDASMCQLRPSEGRRCREDEDQPTSNLAYYYSVRDKQCKLFFHRGCGGNANRFTTLNACERVCKSVA